MSNIFNRRVIAKGEASTGDETVRTFTYKGFSSEETKRKFKLYDIDVVKRDILNHFYIRKGEKLENPNFGTIIWDALYENFTPQVKEEIAKNVEEIINYDPRIRVNTISVDSTDQGIRIEAEIVYLPFNLSERMQLQFDRQNAIT